MARFCGIVRKFAAKYVLASMKRYIYALCIALSSVFLYASCLRSDSSEVTVYDDVAIAEFTLAKVNRYIHTTSKSGKDSVYKKEMTEFPTFTIDQIQFKIYNTDSLPNDCDLKHVLASISTSTYSGGVYFKSLDSDTLWVYSSTDSIDFSQPRQVRVFNNTYEKFRTYEVKINQHQVETDKILWEKKSADDYPDDVNARWKEIVAANESLGQFIGASEHEGYAFSEDGNQIMISKDEGATWEPDNIDGDVSLLPREDIAFVSYPFAPNEDTDYQLMAGVVEEGEIACSIWRKVAEHAEGSQASKWVQLPLEEYNRYYLPAMVGFSLVRFHSYVLAIDSNAIYCSLDGGITWRTSDMFTLPGNGETYFYHVEAMTDEEGALWFKDLDTNNVWRGVLVE